VSERPIIFSGPMVRAILAGKKTQTRRVVRWPIVSNGIAFDRELGDIVCRCDYLPPSEMLMQVRRGKQRYDVARCEGWEFECPYGAPGDTLWVRETWRPHHDENLSTCVQFRADLGVRKPTLWSEREGHWCEDRIDETRWRSPLFMPRWASRLSLRVLSVRVERLQEISEEDAISEGCTPAPRHGWWQVATRDDSGGIELREGGNADTDPPPWMRSDPRAIAPPSRQYHEGLSARTHFIAGWHSINGARAPWSSNPYVWVVEFERALDGAKEGT